MYTQTVPYKDYNQTPRTETVQFQLEIPQIIKGVVELSFLFKWFEVNGENSGPERIIDNEDVKEFFTVFETVLLDAYGKVSEDGRRFERGGRYEFEESKLYASLIAHFLAVPQDLGKFLEEIMPNEDMLAMVKNSSESTAKAIATETDPSRKAELERLQARIAELEEKQA